MVNVKTVYGKFEDNELIDYTTGEIIKCYPYKPVRVAANGKEGFFNLKLDEYNCWILFQFVPIDNNSEHDKVS